METKARQIRQSVTINGVPLGSVEPGIARDIGVCLALAGRQFANELQRTGGAMPGEFPAWDEVAWCRLQAKLGKCECETRGEEPGYRCPIGDYMLMHHDSQTVAAFKHRDTRQYLRA